MSEQYEYLVRGALLQCSCGSFPRRLNLPLCHGVYIGKNPVMNSGDYIPEVNVMSFGTCSKTGSKCMPGFAGYAPWLNVNRRLIVGDEDKYALTTNSYLECVTGGRITVVSSGQEYNMKSKETINKEAFKSEELKEFQENMKKQFNLDDRTAKLIGNVYLSLTEEYPNASQDEIDWRFTRLIGGFVYNDWFFRETAGNALEREGETIGKSELALAEKNYFINKLGFKENDYNYLRYKIRIQNSIIAFRNKSDAYNISDENLGKYKENYEKGYGITLGNNENFKDLWREQIDKLYGNDENDRKGDLAHQFVTMSAILVTDLQYKKDNSKLKLIDPREELLLKGYCEYSGLTSTLLFGDKNREDLSGWLGDSVIHNKFKLNSEPTLGPDDYISDLDSENITYKMKEENIDFLTASNNYYSGLGKDYTRAEKFLEHTSVETVEDKIISWIDVTGDNEFMRLNTKNDNMKIIEEKYSDTYNFIMNLKSKNNTLKPMK